MINKINRPTLNEVAQRAGVHVSTASRALNKNTRHMIGNSIVKNIEKIAYELNYKPNRLAQALRTKKSNGIGVIVPDITNTIFSSMILGIEKGLEQEGYVPVTVNMSEKVASSTSQKIDLLQNFGVDGFILATGDQPQIDFEEIVNSGTPIVMLNRSSVNDNLPCILPDDNDGIRKAFQHLWDFDHRNICMISGPRNISTGISRSKAFKKISSELSNSIGKFPIIYASSYNEIEGEKCMMNILENDKSDITGIILGNDRLAIGALGAIKKFGLHCPDDFSLVGFNNMPLTGRIDPPLTTIDINPYDMGYLAANKLLSLLSSGNDELGKKVYHPVKLIIRSSTKKLI